MSRLRSLYGWAIAFAVVGGGCVHALLSGLVNRPDGATEGGEAVWLALPLAMVLAVFLLSLDYARPRPGGPELGHLVAWKRRWSPSDPRPEYQPEPGVLWSYDVADDEADTSEVVFSGEPDHMLERLLDAKRRRREATSFEDGIR